VDVGEVCVAGNPVRSGPTAGGGRRDDNSFAGDGLRPVSGGVFQVVKTAQSRERTERTLLKALSQFTVARLSRVCSVSDPPADPHVIGDCVHGSLPSQYTLSSVLRSAGLLSLNLRGRGSGFVPANGCLATLLLRWHCVRSRTVLNQIHQIAWGSPFRQVKGDLRFPLTFTYHGCPA
jgi:hypothetical protein